MTASLIFMVVWVLAFVVFAVRRGNMEPFLLGMMIGLLFFLVLWSFTPFPL
jgi:thiamine transporter ThiT